LLVTYQLPNLNYISGETLPLTLVWQAIQKPGGSYSVFVDLVDGSGGIVARQGGVPADRSTEDWVSGTQVVDVHQLEVPQSTPPGDYWLRVGMYDESGPLPVMDAGQYTVADGALVLSSIRVD